MSPTVIVFVRTALAALVLLPLAARAGALGGLRRNVGPILVLAVVQVGGPLLLIALGEREIVLVADRHPGRHRADLHVPARVRARGRGARVGAGAWPASRSASSAWRCCSAWTWAGAAPALVGGLMIVLASLGYGVGALVRQAARARRAAGRDGGRDHRDGRRGDDACSRRSARPSTPPAWARRVAGRAGRARAPALAFVIFYTLCRQRRARQGVAGRLHRARLQHRLRRHAARRELHRGHRRRPGPDPRRLVAGGGGRRAGRRRRRCRARG